MVSTKTDARAKEIQKRLRSMYPDAECALDFRNAYELLIATILAAQSTDRMVNTVTPRLFEKYPDPASLAAASIDELEPMIVSTGFFRNKAKSILGAARAIVDEHGGEVPSTMDDLTNLPGVGRKTANVVLGNAFGLNEGIVVDTHVRRVANRLALTRSEDPVQIEQDLMPLVPKKDWKIFSHRVIDHGRTICHAKKPLCDECLLADVCPSAGVAIKKKVKPRAALSRTTRSRVNSNQRTADDRPYRKR